MAATGKTNSTASLSHKYKLSCKYHSGDHKVFEQILLLKQEQEARYLGLHMGVANAEGRSHALAPHTSQRKVEHNHGEELQMMKSCPESNLPPK